MSEGKNHITPPALGEKLLRLLIRGGEGESLAGDYAELYVETLRSKGRLRAGTSYWFHIFKALWRSGAILAWWRIDMFKNYLIVALRNIKRHKIHSIINISGLALGTACCLLLLLWVNNEVSYDRFHQQGDRIFRILNDLSSGPNTQLTSGCAFPLGPALKAEFPEVEEFTRLLPVGSILVGNGGKRFYETNFIYSDPTLFRMFTFPFILGTPETALSTPSSIVITEAMALKYFGEKNPMGRILRINNQDDYMINGVIKNIPTNSHLQFGFIAPIERAVALGSRTHWTGWFYRTYVQLREGVSFYDVNDKLDVWIKGQDFQAAKYYLQPLKEVYLYGLSGEGPIQTLSLFSLLAVFILIIACINYMNLATARSGSRAKEIGLRKVVGAAKRNIIRQFLSESILTALLSLLIAFVLVAFFLPIFNRISGMQLHLSASWNGSVLPAILGVTLLTGILAGSYPALYLSAFRPVLILKGTLTRSRTGGGSAFLRKGLVVFQFIIAIVLIFGSTIVFKQMQYIRHRELGIQKDHLIHVQLRTEGNLWERYDAEAAWRKFIALKQELVRNPHVLEVAAATCLPFGRMGSEYGYLDWDGKDPELQLEMNHMAVDENFIKTLKLEMVQGRFFSHQYLSEAGNFILNEAAVQAIGLESPLGKRFRLLDREGIIIGVIKDFHYASLHQKIGPMILHTMPYQYWMYRSYVFIRISSEQIQQTLSSLETAWDKVIPEYPISFHFLNETIENLYGSEQRFEKILRIFTLLAIFISCIGLFGLVSFAVEQRTKEMGIRKVLGASVVGIVSLLSKELLLLVVFANAVAWPAAYWAMNRWLGGFAYRSKIGLGIFLFSGLSALAVAVLTISFQAVKAALADPVDSLRYE